MDLPTKFSRWTAGRKMMVVSMIERGVTTRQHASTAFNISPEELDLWIKTARAYGREGLKVTKIQAHRPKSQADFLKSP